MKRREVLVGASACLAVGTAGCSLLGDEDVLDVDGIEVPLVGTDAAADWFHAEESTVFLDARSRSEYESLRIEGAKHSVSPDGLPEDDPTEELAEDTRIVTYCVCPHTLAGRRGASLIEDGFTDVHALDEGLQHWLDEGHPVEGTDAMSEMTSEDLPEPAYHD